MTPIPAKKHWVSTDAWRGYYEYENTIFGGSVYHEASAEQEKKNIAAIKKALRKANIPCKVKWASTSNVFSRVYDIIVRKEDVARGKQIVEQLKKGGEVDA